MLLSRDKKHALTFAPLQGRAAERLLPTEKRTPPLETLLFCAGGQIYERSEAVIRAVAALGGLWHLTRAGLAIPRFLRDAAYSVVARHRFRWFPPNAACRLPTAAERAYFLD
jgi:predicted DCC family thiol-disulfide oxidoreductase YuxK